MEAAFNRRMRKTARPVVWEGAGAQSPALDPIGSWSPCAENHANFPGTASQLVEPSEPKNSMKSVESTSLHPAWTLKQSSTFMPKFVFLLTLLVCAASSPGAQDTLPPLKGGVAPKNFAEMWSDFDLRAEPLEIETFKEWEEDGVVLRIVRFRIGVFKEQKARLAAVYGFPKSVATSGKKLPGLVQIHGGGQYADHKACLMNAKHGYATVSISWAGRISAPDYRVSPPEVKLFWDGKTDDPRHRITTDWGAVDAYHAPSRNPKNNFPSASPAPWTVDSVESPRNSPWFLCAIAARRALTFLEAQPEVDPEKLGVYGHSMGGKLTVMASIDPRVKAAAPSCGGISDRDNASELFEATIGDNVSLKEISCPIIFLSPANDFHGRIGDLPRAIDEIKSQQWRVTCSPHGSHQDNAEYEVATLLWFDHHLKGNFSFPKTPVTKLTLRNKNGTPTISVQPDMSRPVLSVEVFYTQHGKDVELSSDRENTKNRFWHHAKATASGKTWTAKLPLGATDKPLWVYANVAYALEKPVSGAGYYYRTYTASSFKVSSLLEKVSPAQLKAAGVKAALKPSLLIESFAGDWEKEWFTYWPDDWARQTHKVYADQWRAPMRAKLALDVRTAQSNKLVVGIDEYATEVQVSEGLVWHQVELTPSDFQKATGEKLRDWNGIGELRLGSKETLRSRNRGEETRKTLGADWKGPKPEFRNLRWVAE